MKVYIVCCLAGKYQEDGEDILGAFTTSEKAFRVAEACHGWVFEAIVDNDSMFPLEMIVEDR